MNIKNGIVVVGFWTLLVAPLLCGVGVLMHSCPCEEITECPHELQGSADPHQVLAFRSTGRNSEWGYSTDLVEQLNPPALVDDFVALFEAQPELFADPTSDLPKIVVLGWSLPLLC